MGVTMSEIEHVVRTEVGSVCEVISVRPERTATPILNLVNFKHGNEAIRELCRELEIG